MSSYLEDGFDPQSLKMSAIRGILVQHSVDFPSNAKKPELLQLLQETVLARAPKLRKEAKRRVKGDGRDIEQVAGTAAGPSAATIGSRTRSQTPRTERVRPPMLGAHSKGGDEAVAAAAAAKGAEEPLKKKKKKTKKPKSDKELDKALVRELAKELTKAPATEQLTPPRAGLGRAAEVKRTAGAKRKLSDAEQSADSGDEDVFTPARRQMGDAQRLRIAKQRQETHEAGEAADRNFSDENPFQSSPETARKRRRKASAEGRPATPMSALRKSQVSDVSFRVALPKSPPGREETPERHSSPLSDDQIPPPHPESPILRGSPDPLELPDELPPPQRTAGRVGDLVARYQGQPPEQPPQPAPPRSPTVRIRAELPRLPSASEALPPPAPVPVPVVEIEHPAHGAAERPPPLPAPRASHSEAARARFTMTPDAMRQLALAADQPRRTTMAAGLPPVAPNIPAPAAAPRYAQARVAGSAEQPSIAQAELDAQDLQRRRVATLREHVDSADEAAAARHRHSRRSSIASIASSVGEARGIPA
ncbi:inner nuclear membrane protein enriched at telomere/subtelomere region, partial [Coemansia helicoidea]